ncbi:DUF4111 domain-containing protein [Cellulomonas humilata]|uniref:DUF4111 domain-containing protein n=1 Tax=Cellulomonas humilata TaxID=144055 RepID=A0A7Y6A5W8_9CELL|nr:DUF4111 domain-containing protein [Cellulomonas humilata]
MLAELQAIVGDDLLGLYLYGSSVAGGLRPASDVDLLGVTRTSLHRSSRARLAGRIRAISGSRGNGRSLELTVVVQSQVTPWRYPPTADFVYGDWLGDSFAEPTVTGPAATPNLAIEITQVLGAGHVVAGPSASELLDPVPPGDVARACRDCIPGLLADLDGDERNVILTCARIWCTLESGEIRSKDQAADWALPRLSADLRPVLQHARDLYLTTTYEDETWPSGMRGQSRELVERIVAQLP